MEANTSFSRTDAGVTPSETSDQSGGGSIPHCWHAETLAAEGAPKSRGCAPSGQIQFLMSVPAFNLNKSVSILRSVTNSTCSSVSHSLPKQLQQFRMSLLLSCLSPACAALPEHVSVHLCQRCPAPSRLMQTQCAKLLGETVSWSVAAFSCYHGGKTSREGADVVGRIIASKTTTVSFSRSHLADGHSAENNQSSLALLLR